VLLHYLFLVVVVTLWFENCLLDSTVPASGAANDVFKQLLIERTTAKITYFPSDYFQGGTERERNGRHIGDRALDRREPELLGRVWRNMAPRHRK
jgi:hypothetical protein